MKTVHPPSSSCNCAACREKAAGPLYPHWKERRRRRLDPDGRHSAECNCAACRAEKEAEWEWEYDDDDFHTYWRRRRQLRHGWPLDVEWEEEMEDEEIDPA